MPTLKNPADCASRDLFGDELRTNTNWWQRPSWLRFPKDEWPPELTPHVVGAPLEEKAHALHISTLLPRWDLASRYSSWPKLIRVTAYIFKFIRAFRCLTINARYPESLSKALSSAECNEAKTFWIKQIQNELFSDDIRSLSNDQNVASKSSIAALRPFLDSDGVLRVGGRLRHAPFPYRIRHPILPASHPLVHLIALQAHHRALHGGPQLTLGTLRQDF